MSRHIVVIGDVLLDRDIEGISTRLCPEAPAPVVDVECVHTSPGGAGLAALLCADTASTGIGEGRLRVTLVAAVSDDDAGRKLTRLLGSVTLIPLGHEGPTRRKTRVRSSGQTLARIDDGGPGTPRHVDHRRLSRVLASADAVLVADYGGGMTRDATVRTALTGYLRDGGQVVWDPHPRGDRAVAGCTLITPNSTEARGVLGAPAGTADARLATELRRAWAAKAAAVTSGSAGAWFATEDDAMRHDDAVLVRTSGVHTGDSCGAGDRFSSAAVVSLALGRCPRQAVEDAVTASTRWVADGGAAGYRQAQTRTRSILDEVDDRLPLAARRLIADVRARGGRIVATGGCFDVLHAGHIECLEAARALGDALIVLLNSDASVTRLKGPGRPVNPQRDRARLIQALECVDAVVGFEQDDPRATLALIRPDVWVKGGDYTEADLPEAPDIDSWGGRVAVLPYLDGRSTTAILERMSDAHR